jgi:hypothetical protein
MERELDQRLKKCSICGEEYWGYGNNAEPINSGRCCDECNAEVVISRFKKQKMVIDKKEIYKMLALEITIVVLLMHAMFSWFNWRDEKLMQASEAYEECVETQYHTTPSEYRAEYGSYPICDSK